MWFEDLAPWNRSPRILTVGWLERGRDYPVGEVDHGVYEKLKRLLVAPELILHYMNTHHYRPPERFCDAVTACPEMGTMEYRRALLAVGGPGFLKEVGTA